MHNRYRDQAEEMRDEVEKARLPRHGMRKATKNINPIRLAFKGRKDSSQ